MKVKTAYKRATLGKRFSQERKLKKLQEMVTELEVLRSHLDITDWERLGKIYSYMKAEETEAQVQLSELLGEEKREGGEIVS